MKVVILAGGLGSRLAEETAVVPKPLVMIGPKPILWHVMKIYAAAGFDEFVICCGYKAHLIKSYFVNYFAENQDITVDLAANSVAFHGSPAEKWKVTLIDTGADTMTGGRIKRIAPYVGGETFCLTYGDGVAALNVRDVVKFHRDQGRKATVTAVPAPGRFGILDLGGDGKVASFREKAEGEMGWINGGFFVCEPSVFDYIDGDATHWEHEPLERLSSEGQLMAHRFKGFWKPVDTLRDKRELEDLWLGGNAPWKIW
ncbi:MAG: glucose-1-phosphate cytidylyltransferase [Bradyrhizobium sp.]